MALKIQVSDLLSKAGTARHEDVSLDLEFSLPNASVSDEVAAALDLRSIVDGVVLRGRADVVVELTCTRCLTEWQTAMQVPLEAVFRLEPDDEDDELPIEPGGWIDVEPVIHDEVSLAVPAKPVCREDCAGLCPTCGTDLNENPCDGHGDVPDSPFAALRDLFAGEPSQQSES
jgi:uncharacterized protein